mgnify:CR=1 FL=1
MPSIAGLSEAYLKHVMMEWKSGARASANMTRLIKGYTDEEIAVVRRAERSTWSAMCARRAETATRCVRRMGTALAGSPPSVRRVR